MDSWICSNEILLHKFLISNSVNNKFIYADGFNNITIPISKDRKSKKYLDHKKIYKISKILYFGWDSEKLFSKDVITILKSSIIFKLKMINNLISKNSKYEKYISDLKIDRCTNNDLVIFAKYFDKIIHEFNDKYSLRKYTEILSKNLRKSTNAENVFLILDSSYNYEFINLFSIYLAKNFNQFVLIKKFVIEPQFPDEVITHYLSNKCPNAFIYSFDGPLAYISFLQGCKNKFYLDKESFKNSSLNLLP